MIARSFRFARFRWTAFPMALLAEIPILVNPDVDGDAINTTNGWA